MRRSALVVLALLLLQLLISSYAFAAEEGGGAGGASGSRSVAEVLFPDEDTAFSRVYQAITNPDQFVNDVVDDLIEAYVPNVYQEYAKWLWDQVSCLLDLRGLAENVCIRGICNDYCLDLVEVSFLVGRKLWRHYKRKDDSSWKEGAIPDKNLKGKEAPVVDLTARYYDTGTLDSEVDLYRAVNRPVREVLRSEGQTIKSLAELPLPVAAGIERDPKSGSVYNQWSDMGSILTGEVAAVYRDGFVPLDGNLVSRLASRSGAGELPYVLAGLQLRDLVSRLVSRSGAGKLPYVLAGLQLRERNFMVYYMAKNRRLSEYRKEVAQVRATYSKQVDPILAAGWLHDTIDLAGSLEVGVPFMPPSSVASLAAAGLGELF